MNQPTIKQFEELERPREKFQVLGKESLSNTELIGLLLGTGGKNKTAIDLAKDLLSRNGNSLQRLAQSNVYDMCQTPGIGQAKALHILAAIELGGRLKSESIHKRRKITSSNDAYMLIEYKLSSKNHEEFWIITLNRANHFIRQHCISRGGFSQTVVDPKLVFRCALEDKASALILCHNHPSGNMKPSQADRQLTQRLIDAGKLLEIQILDHLIIGQNTYLSFADEAML